MTALFIALKDLRLMLRDRVAVFWVLVFPLVFAGFFGSVMRAAIEPETATEPAVWIVEEPFTERSALLREGLSDSGLSLRTGSAEAARDAVRRGDALAYVHATPGKMGGIEIGVDPARRTEGAMLRGLVLRAVAAEYGPADPIVPNVEAVTVAELRDGSRPLSGFEIVFPAVILWGLMGCAATFAISIVSERSAGTLLRLRAAPIPRGAILGGKASALTVACLFDATLLTLLGHFLLDVRIADVSKLAAAIAAIVLCFAGLTMTMAVLGRTEQGVAGAGWSLLIILAMLGGAMVPLAVMPPWLLEASELSPVKWGITALEGATWRGLDWPALARPLWMLCGLGVAGLAFGATVLSRREV